MPRSSPPAATVRASLAALCVALLVVGLSRPAPAQARMRELSVTATRARIAAKLPTSFTSIPGAKTQATVGACAKGYSQDPTTHRTRYWVSSVTCAAVVQVANPYADGPYQTAPYPGTTSGEERDGWVCGVGVEAGVNRSVQHITQRFVTISVIPPINLPVPYADDDGCANWGGQYNAYSDPAQITALLLPWVRSRAAVGCDRTIVGCIRVDRNGRRIG